MDTSYSSLNTNVDSNYNSLVGTASLTGSDAIDPFINLWTDDSLTSLGANLKKVPYTSLSENPTLPNPTSSSLAVKLPSYEFTAEDLAKLDAKLTSSEGNQFLNNVQEQVQQGTISTTQSQKLVFYYMHPEIAAPEDIQDQLAQLTGSSSSASSSAANSALKSTFDRQASNAYDAAFESLIQEQVSAGVLTQTQANQAIFSHYHPSEGSALTDVEQQALSQITTARNIPQDADWTPATNTESYDGKLMSTYDTAFENALTNATASPEVADLATQTGLTKEQIVSFAKFQHYFPDADITEFSTSETKEAFKTLVASLNQTAKTAVGAQFSIPDDFQLDTASVIQERIFNGTYADQVVTLLQQYRNNAGVNLTNEEMSLVASYFSNPDNPNIPDNLKEIAQSIQSQAMATVKSTYNLPGAWVPNAISASDFATANSSINRTIASLEAQLNTGVKLALAQRSPEREVYMDYLAKILSAIQSLKEQMYANEVSDSEKSKSMSSSKLEQTLQQLDYKARMNEKVQKQEAKAKKWGVLGKIFQPIIKFFTMVVAAIQFIGTLFSTLGSIMVPPAILATGPALAGAGTALALSVMSFIDSVHPEGKLVEKFFSAIDNAVKSPFNIMVKMAVLIGVVMSSMAASAMDLGPSMLEKSGIIQAMVKAAGGDEQAQELAAMIISMIISLAITIVMAILTAGAGLGKVVGDAMKVLGKVSAEVAKAIAEAGTKAAQAIAQASQLAARAIEGVAKGTAEMVNTLTKALMNILRPLIKALEKASENSPRMFRVAQAVVESFQDVLVGTSQLASGIILGNVSKMKGEIDANTEVFEALIAILEKVLQNLLNNLPTIGDFATQLNSDVMNMFDKLSQQMTAAHQA